MPASSSGLKALLNAAFPPGSLPLRSERVTSPGAPAFRPFAAVHRKYGMPGVRVHESFRHLASSFPSPARDERIKSRANLSYLLASKWCMYFRLPGLRAARGRGSRLLLDGPCLAAAHGLRIGLKIPASPWGEQVENQDQSVLV